MDLNLENKTVVISGATGKIGTTICKAFLKEKAIVIPLYQEEEQYKIDRLLNEENNNDLIYPVTTDVHNEKQLTNTFKQIYKTFK